MKQGNTTPLLSADSPEDQCSAWLTVACNFAILAITFGNLRAYSVIQAEMMINYATESNGVFGVQGVAMSSMLGIVPVATALSKQFHTRVVMMIGAALASFGCIASAFVVTVGQNWLYLTFSVFMGSGTGICIAISAFEVTRYFTRHLVLAGGIMFTGATAGALLWPYILRLLLDTYAVPGTLAISGAIILHCFPVAHLARPTEYYGTLGYDEEVKRKEEYGSNNESKYLHHYASTEIVDMTITDTKEAVRRDGISTKKIDKTNFGRGLITEKIQKDNSTLDKYFCAYLTKIVVIADSLRKSCLLVQRPMVILFGVCYALLDSSLAASLVALPAFAVESNFSKLNISVLMGTVALSELFGRGLISGISDLRILQGRLPEIYIVSTMLYGSSAIICSFIPSLTSLMIYSVFFGVFGQSSLIFTYVLLVDTFGKQLFPDVMAYMSIFEIVSPIASVFFCQYIGELTRSWAWAMLCCGVFAVLSSFCLVYKIILDTCRKH